MNANEQNLIQYVIDGDIRKAQEQVKIILDNTNTAKDSVFKVSIAQHIKLSIEEMAAINNHMGFTAGYEIAVGECYEHNTLAWILHVADEAAAYWWRT